MVLTPQDRDELARALKQATEARTPIGQVNLTRIAALVEHRPEDMTATVEGGMTLLDFQTRIGKHSQWLPLDPMAGPGLTLGDLLADDLSGPRRLAYGTARDYVIGIKVALANGEIVKAGGKVVKNVAGYDLCKLFVGARHTLGIIVEATFKLRPVPEVERIFEASFPSLEKLREAARALLSSPAQPVLLDAHNLAGQLKLVTGFAGVREDVSFQMALLHQINTWTEIAGYGHSGGAIDSTSPKMSVAPNAVYDALNRLKGGVFLARIGNGVIYHSAKIPAQPVPNRQLTERVKTVYDPAGIFPAYSR